MMVMATEKAVVRKLSREDIVAERAELLASVEANEAELRRRAEEWDLAPGERGVLARVDGLDWLLEHAEG